MGTLRAQVERDLGTTLEGDFGMPVEITSPDGETQIYNVNNPSELLMAQVLYFSRRENPETGETIVVNQPVVTLRISSLIRVPVPGERWFVRMAISPVPGSPVQNFVFSADRSPESGTDIGFIRLYPQRIEREGAGPVSS